METTELAIETGEDSAVIDITSSASKYVAGLGDGLLSVFVPHATAGLAVIEVGAGSDADLLDALDQVLPRDRSRWRHEHGTPGHGRDHVLPAFISPSLTIPVVDVASPWAPGSRSSWSTPMSTIGAARCGSPSSQADHGR
jgi:thiamine phosphate synthase YjbQ (UPF0047 family)